jgi:uncharacterized protein (TIGR02246 family)
MHYFKFAAIILMLATAMPAWAQDNPIVARMEAFAEAYNAADAQAIAGFYADDGALLPPGSKIVTGKQSIADHYATAFGQGVSDLQFRILEIRQAGPATAVEIGETQVKAGNRTIHGRYLHVWTKEGEIWSLSRDMYHVLGIAD